MIYYRRFLTLSNHLIKRKQISNMERSIQFIQGFHPDDRECLMLRVSAMNPHQPADEPYDLKDTLIAARRQFFDVRLSDSQSRELRDDTVHLHPEDPEEWMRRVFGQDDRDPSFRQDRDPWYDRASRNDHDDVNSRKTPSDRDFQERPSDYSSPQSQTQPATSLITQSDHMASYFRPRRNKGCFFCAELGHYVRQCSTAMDYVNANHAVIINDRLRLPNGRPIPNDGRGRSLKLAIDEWLAANTVSSTLLLTL
jgi:hypothetical protein